MSFQSQNEWQASLSSLGGTLGNLGGNLCGNLGGNLVPGALAGNLSSALGKRAAEEADNFSTQQQQLQQQQQQQQQQQDEQARQDEGEDADEDAGPRARQLRLAFELAINGTYSASQQLLDRFEHLEPIPGLVHGELEKVTLQMLRRWRSISGEEFDDIMRATKCTECLNSLDMDHLELMRRGQGGEVPAMGSGASGPVEDNIPCTGQEDAAFMQELRAMGIRATPPPVASASGPLPGISGRSVDANVVSAVQLNSLPVSLQAWCGPANEELEKIRASLDESKSREAELYADVEAEKKEEERLLRESMQLLQKLQTNADKGLAIATSM